MYLLMILVNHFYFVRDRRQISLLIVSEFKGSNELLFSLKLTENPRFSDDLRETEFDKSPLFAKY